MANRDKVEGLLLVGGVAAVFFFVRLYRKVQARDEDMARLIRYLGNASNDASSFE